MGKPTIRELLDALDVPRYDSTDGAEVMCAADELAERVEAVLKLHALRHPAHNVCPCGEPWPCPTISALDGER